MDNLQRVLMWIAAGKQVGKSFSFLNQGIAYRSSVAVQKWQNGYKLYIDEIEEEYLAGEEYVREELIYRQDIFEIAYIITNTTTITLSELAPRKGQKIFNPAFEESDTTS
jgi:hypothetical protein